MLAAPFDRDKAERARNKFIEIQVLIDALDRAIGGEGGVAPKAEPLRTATVILVRRLTPRHLASVELAGWPGSCFDRFALT